MENNHGDARASKAIQKSNKLKFITITTTDNNNFKRMGFPVKCNINIQSFTGLNRCQMLTLLAANRKLSEFSKYSYQKLQYTPNLEF